MPLNKEQKIIMATVIVAMLLELYDIFLFVNNLSLNVQYNFHYAVYVVISLFGIVAAITALASQLRKTLLLRLYFIYFLAALPLGMIGSVFTYAAWTTRLGFSFWFYRFMDIALFVGIFYSLRYLVSQRSVKLVATDVDSGIEMLPTLTGPWRRFANRMLDSLVVVIISVGLYSHISTTMEYFESISRPEHQQLFNLETVYMIQTVLQALRKGLGPYIITFLIFPPYYVFFEYFFQTTFGKTATGCRVADTHQQKPGLARIMLRTLCRYIPFDGLSFLFSTHHRGFHDKFSETYVIDDVSMNPVNAQSVKREPGHDNF